MNQTLEGYTSRFWKNIFRPKYIDFVQSVQSYRVYRYPAISAKHFSFANTAVDSVVNATLNLARHSKTVLSGGTWSWGRGEDEGCAEGENGSGLPSAGEG